jgi:hypothetical protein
MCVIKKPRKGPYVPVGNLKEKLMNDYEMTKFQITRDVEMRKFVEQPPESASPLP